MQFRILGLFIFQICSSRCRFGGDVERITITNLLTKFRVLPDSCQLLSSTLNLLFQTVVLQSEPD